MRSKEVDDAIKLTYENLNQDKNELIRVIEYKRGDTMKEYLEKEIKRSETLLAYISELDEENKKQRGQLNSAFDNGFIHKDKIRDKIKELEENRDKYVEENKFGSYMEAEGMIKGLKSIIGE